MALNLKLIGDICNLYIKQNNEFIGHNHMTGKAVIFNSELEHYADNKSNSNRIILYIDFQVLL
jgi:aspartyl/asparaginyl beta-hydroxylase (cupin superfamily)